MIPERYAPITYALFRIVFGFHVLHVTVLQKMLGWFGGQAAPLASMHGAAGVIETVCGLLIMVGLFIRLAAFLASGEMAVAYFIAHVPSRRPTPDREHGRSCGRVLFRVPLHLRREAQVSGASTA